MKKIIKIFLYPTNCRFKLTLARILLLLLLVNFAEIPVALASRTGEQVYQIACQACHANGVANAPRAHDQAAWETRYKLTLAKIMQDNPNLPEKEQKAAVMKNWVLTVKNGLNAMPAGGMCSDCNDEEYQAAIAFMLSKDETPLEP